MALILVGGHSRSVGKTSAVAAIIAALPEFEWTAVKVTQFGHGICSRSGQPCDCACGDRDWVIEEELCSNSGTDTARFLAAGATRVLWVRSRVGVLGDVLPALRTSLEGARNVIAESNSLAGLISPDLYLTLLDAGNSDFKQSAARHLQAAHAVLAVGGLKVNPQWPSQVPERLEGKRVLTVNPPSYINDEVVKLVRSVVHGS